MKARYENDNSKGPGHGLLHISDLAEIASLEGLCIGLKRASDQKCLALGGWQSAEHTLPVQGLALTDDGIALNVGPEFVDNIDTVETYRLSLVFADGSKATAMLDVPEVAYSPQDGGAGLGASQVLAPPPVAPLPVAPEPEPEPEPLPEPEPQISPEPMPEVPPMPAPVKKNNALPVVLLAAALLLGGAFAVWHFALNKEDAPVAEPESPRIAPLDAARQHLAGEANPEVSLSMAKELRAAPDGADAAFLLAEDAAQKGLAEAMLLTASFYDPASDAPNGSIEKDPEQAFNWYAMAKSKGGEAVLQEVEARLAALKEWAGAEAEKGNAAAKDLLNKM